MFVKALDGNVAPVAKIGAMVEKLKTAGFVMDIAPAVISALHASVQKARDAVSAAAGRVEEIDQILRGRGMFLFGFQRSGVTWLAPKTGALLSDEMGLGKTIQTLAALPSNAPVIVVCPAVAKGVWKQEAAAWRPDFKVSVLGGRGSFRWPAPGEIVVTNYDILPDYVTSKDSGGFEVFRMPEALEASCPDGLVVVVDEAHATKNGKAARTRKVRAMAKLAREKNGKSWGLTATPMLNEPTELWTVLMNFGCAHESFGSFGQYKQMMGGYDGPYGIVWAAPEDPAVIGERLRRVVLRRLRAQVLPDLPTKIWKNIPVEIDAKTAKLCDKVLKNLADKGVSLEDLDQVVKASASGATFEEMSKARAALATAKMKATLDLVEDFEEQSEPLVVFSAHRAVIDTLGEREGWRTITGDTSSDERTDIKDLFQAGKLKGIACTIKAGGVAITLTRAHHAVFVDLEWTPALNAQAEDRICRIGQDKGCIIIRLVANHELDERITALLAHKAGMIGATVEQAVVTDAPAPMELQGSDVDFEKLAADAKAAAEKVAEEKAAAERIAKEREEQGAKLRAEREAQEKKEREERKEREKKEKAEATALKRARAKGWVVDADDPDRHEPRTAQEKWAHAALAALSGDDADHALFQNGIGFNKGDSFIGHWMNLELATNGGLTTSQWKIAIDTCRKYHRQVGRCPKGEE